jgi:hypothetical protein
LIEVTVDGAATGVRIAESDPPRAEPAVDATFAAISGCGDGVRLDVGALALRSSAVTTNQASGIIAGDGEGDTELTLEDVLVSANGDTGVRLAVNRRLEVRRSRVCDNGAVTERGTAFITPGRRVGGIHIFGPPPAATGVVRLFTANKIFGNAGDQILVTAGSGAGPWRLDGATSTAGCVAGDSNLIAEYDDDSSSPRGIYAAFATVSARFNAWGNSPPLPAPAGRDFEEGPSASIDAGTADEQFCLPVAVPACE